ncbi:MAG TPA: pyruvate kinase [Acidimicrobiia bacterium]|nr:pyruvate kinase [Acidimicrobiia bacterium]
MERYTKIVATLGPAVATADKVRALVLAGIDVARLNFSHGDHAFHRQLFDWVRLAAADTGRNIAVLQDIQGPKLRVGSFPGGMVELPADAVVQLRPGRDLATEPDIIYLDYPYLLEDVEPGEEVLLTDGLIRLVVTAREADHLQARVDIGGVLHDGRGVAFPRTNLRVPAVTKKDEVDLAFGRELGVDWVAASFVRTGADVRTVRDLAGGVPVVAKVELAAAYANLDDIIREAAGVMVARGDLGVQLPLERIPLIQADILRRTNEAGLVSITATEMLESMTHSPRPTRAEVTDVATAVLAGTDAVMLSAETAIGLHPVEAVAAMARICATVESETSLHTVQHTFLTNESAVASAVAQAAVDAAANLGIETIVAFTESGSTARLLSKYRPAARIVAFTPVESTRRRMALYRGVTAYPFERREYTDHMIAAAEKILEKEKVCQRGEAVVMVAGIPPNQQATTNLIKVHVIGDRARGVQSQRTVRSTPEGSGRPLRGG